MKRTPARDICMGPRVPVRKGIPPLRCGINKKAHRIMSDLIHNLTVSVTRSRLFLVVRDQQLNPFHLLKQSRMALNERMKDES